MKKQNKVIISVRKISKCWLVAMFYFVSCGYLHADKYTDLCTYLATVVAQHGNIVHLDTIGKSVQGRNILAIKISDNPAVDENEPELLIEGATHGGEVKGSQLIAPYFIDYLTDNYGIDTYITQLINTREIWFVPMVNPDGAAKSTPSDDNANTVNLNRDYGYMWKSASPNPFSQPETKAMRKFFIDHQFVVAVSHHDGANSVGYAWSATKDAIPTDNALDTIAKGYATHANPVYPYGQAAKIIYTAVGSSKDFYYGTRGAMSWTLETGSLNFPNLFNQNKNSLLYLIEASGYGVNGIITDNVSGLPLQAMVTVDNFQPCYSDIQSGDYYKFATLGTRKIVAWANGYEKKVVLGVVVPRNNAVITNIQLQKNNKYYAQEVVGCYINNITSAYTPLYTPDALGPIDNVSLPLGANGWVILDMGVNITDQTGKDFKVYEGTEQDAIVEKYTVYVSNDPTDAASWKSLGIGTGSMEFDIQSSGLASVRYIKITDNANGSTGKSPGFDLDGIENYYTVVDAGVVQIIAPPDVVNKGSNYTPSCKVTNFGTAPSSFSVTAEIDINGVIIYSKTSNVTNLAASASTDVSFDPWTVLYPQVGFKIRFKTTLANDVNPGNNEMTKNMTRYNSAPVISTIPDQSFNVGKSVTIALDQYVADAEESDAVLLWNYEILGGAGALSVNIDASHTATINATSPWTGKLVFKSTDIGGLSDTDTIMVVVKPAPSSVEIVINDVNSMPGDTVDIPIWINGNLVGKKIISSDIVITFDPTIISVYKILTGEIVPQDWTKDDTISAGKIKISLSATGNNEIVQTGRLIIISFIVQANAAINDTTTIHIQKLWLNEGTVIVDKYDDGLFTVAPEKKYNIKGKAVYYSNSSAISNVTFVLSPSKDSCTTGVDGSYSYGFNDVVAGCYVITPYKFNSSIDSNVTSYDATLAFRHRLKLDVLSPYQQLAADVSGNDVISAHDVSLILKYSVGKLSHFPVGDWKFVPDNRQYMPIVSNQDNDDYISILYGDVSGNWKDTKGERLMVNNRANIALENTINVTTPLNVNNVNVSIPAISGNPGDTIYVPIIVSDLTGLDITDFDIKLIYNSTKMYALPVERGDVIPSTGWTFGSNVKGDTIDIVICSGNSLPGGSGSIAVIPFVIKSDATNGAVNLQFVRCWINDNDVPSTPINGVITVGYLEILSTNTYNFNITPNPSASEVNITYQLPTQCKVEVSIYNVIGKLEKVLVSEQHIQGSYTLQWIPENSGVYFCKINMNGVEKVKKFVVIQKD